MISKGNVNDFPGTIVYFLSVFTIVIFPSNWANRSPTQVLGPLPNGIQAMGCLSARFFEENLKIYIKNINSFYLYKYISYHQIVKKNLFIE